MFRSTLTILRPIFESCFLQLLATYWDPAMFTNYASVHACYKYIKLGVEQWMVSDLCVGVA